MLDDADARKAQIRATFDRLAPEYDTAVPGCFAYFGRRLVECVGIAPGARVLDVATGRGAVLFPAIERAGPTGHVVGIDLAEQMVRTTNGEASAQGLGEPARVMDAEQLDFPDGSFSVVLCGFGVMFMPHLDHAAILIRPQWARQPRHLEGREHGGDLRQLATETA
jgi:O-methyltransferase/aklanonic acid methyltransferase